MTETKLEISKRLRKVGVWDEAERLREEVRLKLRAEGVPRKESVERAWEAVAEKYPMVVEEEPRPVVLPIKPPASVTGASVGMTAEVEATADDVDVAEDVNSVILAMTAGSSDFRRDVEWVYSNFSRVVIDAPGRSSRCDFSRATSPPPSSGAVGLMHWAGDNRTAFFGTVAPKHLAKQESADAEEVEEEEMKIAEALKILKRYELTEEELYGKAAGRNGQLQRWLNTYGRFLPDGGRDELQRIVLGTAPEAAGEVCAVE